MASLITEARVANSSDSWTTPAIRPDEFRVFSELIHRETGIYLNESKKELLCSRLAKRLRHFGFRSFSEYHELLTKSDPRGEERLQLINCITTNKTDFFRESHHFDFLREKGLPEVVKRAAKTGQKRLRIWCAASSTGEEPYTLALVVREFFTGHYGWDLRIIASDIDTEVLAKAQAGVYPAERAATVPQPLLHKYFLKGTGNALGQVQATRELKDLITFQRINLMDGTWPLQPYFDFIFCRNVIIYFDRPTQQKLMERFAKLLHPDGYLVLGHSENLHWLTDTYTASGATIYSLVGNSQPKSPGRLVLSAADGDSKAESKSASSHGTTPSLPTPSSLSRPTRCKTGKVPVDAWRTNTSPSSRPLDVANQTLREKSIIVGEVYASREPAKVQTLLGSCVSACLFDPETRIGGMNHFSLPKGQSDGGNPARFGVHAMEMLINEIMKLGGDRRRLQAKIFGGGRVIDAGTHSFHIGQKNVNFVREFLATERIPIASHRLGGETGVRVVFLTHSGKALIKPLESRGLVQVAEQEQQQIEQLAAKMSQPSSDDVILF